MIGKIIRAKMGARINVDEILLEEIREISEIETATDLRCRNRK